MTDIVKSSIPKDFETYKLEVTKRLYFYHEINNTEDKILSFELPSIEKCLKSWWFSAYSTRLSEKGLESFRIADIEEYYVPITDKTVLVYHEIPQISFKFSKTSLCPFYIDIQKKQFILFDNKAYLKIKLHSDTITQYIERKYNTHRSMMCFGTFNELR